VALLNSVEDFDFSKMGIILLFDFADALCLLIQPRKDGKDKETFKQF